MEQALFRIGGVYRTNGGAVVELFNAGHGWGFIDVPVFNGINLHGRAGSNNGQWLKDGRYFSGPGGQEAMSLIPGELHQFGGEWFAEEEKAEQPMAPYFAEAVEEERALDEFDAAIDRLLSQQAKAYKRLVEIADPNAAMILRDGPAITRPAPPPVAQEATSHAPLAGLTVLMERDHRLGSCVVHGE